MQLPNRYLLSFTGAALAASLLAGPTVRAAPLGADSKPAAETTASADTPQGREFRAGVQAQIKGDLAAAQARYEAALKIDPKFAPAYIGLARVAQAQGKAPQVEQFLQQAERANPKSADVHMAWGRYLLGNQQMERAEKRFLTARELAPKAIPPLLELGEVYIRTPGRAADAVRAYKAAVALDARNIYAQYGLGTAAAVAGQREDAFGAFEKTAALAPKDPAPLRAIGRLHFEAGAMDKALAAFDRGLARAPQFVPLMLDRADTLARQNRMNDAIAQITSAEKLAPRSAEVQIKLADAYQGAQRWPEAEAAYLKAIEIEPRSALPNNNLAWMTVVRGGDAKKAVEWAGKAVSLSPGSSPFHDTLGWAHRAAGNLGAAQSSLQKAIELEPKVAGYHLHLGIARGELKQAAAARASLLKALELESRGPQADEARRALKALPPA